MAHITFNYSKLLDKFVAPHEVDFLQAQVTAADEMIRKEQAQVLTSLDGVTFQKTMIVKNLIVS